MKLQRIIHHLEDGRRKYVTHNGEMEKWTEVEIEIFATMRNDMALQPILPTSPSMAFPHVSCANAILVRRSSAS